MKICILGAGVVGLTTAYMLAREGHEVQVLDAEAGPGLGTSYGNGAQLSYSYVAPFAAPGVVSKVPGWLLDPDGPMRLRPDFTWNQIRWMYRFWRACNATQSDATTAALLRLAFHARAQVHELVEREGLDFAYSRAGKLVVYSDAAGLEAAKRQVAMQAAFGSEQEALGREECLSREPALANIAHRIAGGIWTPGEDAGDCHLFCTGLDTLLRGSNFNVAFHYGTRVTQLLTAGGRVVGAATPKGVFEADAFVLCLGIGARALAGPIGIDLPIYPLKGYSYTVPAKAGAPHVSITDSKAKVVYARLGGRLRIAGMADVVGEDRRFDNRRLDTLLRQAREAFPDAADWNELHPWTGLRPATPTGLPIIGRSRPWSNLVLNVGQGALGFTLGMGCGALVADALAGRPMGIAAGEFAP
jgi:D-amino-acid dehydrogenase